VRKGPSKGKKIRLSLWIKKWNKLFSNKTRLKKKQRIKKQLLKKKKQKIKKQK
jgi:hypothetical protein